jgi:hypothetical protein
LCDVFIPGRQRERQIQNSNPSNKRDNARRTIIIIIAFYWIKHTYDLPMWLSKQKKNTSLDESNGCMLLLLNAAATRCTSQDEQRTVEGPKKYTIGHGTRRHAVL